MSPRNLIIRLIAPFLLTMAPLAVPKSARVAPSKSTHPYVAHPFQCRSCHEEQYEFWSKTQHASAYLVLYAKQAHFDPECIACHSLGFDSPQGFSRIAHPLRLTNPAEDPHQAPFVEKLMQEVFKADSKGPLDSREQPERYAKLHKKYDETIRKLEAENKLAKLYVGVQCEHCHGNRDGHPAKQAGSRGPVSETTCRKCHAPPNAPNFQTAMIGKIACPLLNPTKKKR